MKNRIRIEIEQLREEDSVARSDDVASLNARFARLLRITDELLAMIERLQVNSPEAR